MLSTQLIILNYPVSLHITCILSLTILISSLIGGGIRIQRRNSTPLNQDCSKQLFLTLRKDLSCYFNLMHTLKKTGHCIFFFRLEAFKALGKSIFVRL